MNLTSVVLAIGGLALAWRFARILTRRREVYVTPEYAGKLRVSHDAAAEMEERLGTATARGRSVPREGEPSAPGAMSRPYGGGR